MSSRTHEKEGKTMNAFDQVIGYEPIKEEMMQVCDMIRNPEVYQEMGAMLPRGMLLHGAPGLGKTLMAKALIRESGLQAFTVRKSKGKSNLLDEISEAFRKAEEQAPAIVFLDDMDKFANEDSNHRDAEEYVAIQSAIDDTRDKGVFVLATVNDMNKLPRSLRRCGRFDRQIEFDSPNPADAGKIMEYYLRGKKIDPSVNLDDLSRMLDCESCAVLETVLNEAAIYAAYSRKETICTEDLVRAVLRKAYDSPETFRKMSEEEIRKTAMHEAGHAVICEALIPGGVGMVSVRAEGEHTGGIMHRCAETVTAGQVILISLGGKAAAEMLCPGEAAEGCSMDIAKAVRGIRQKMENDAALGFGLIDVQSDHYNEMSEFLNHKGEIVVQTELERYMRRAREILQQNRTFLEQLTDELAEKETLLHSDIRRIRLNCAKEGS